MYEQEKQLEKDKNAAVVASAKDAAANTRDALMGRAKAMGQISDNMASILLQSTKQQS